MSQRVSKAGERCSRHRFISSHRFIVLAAAFGAVFAPSVPLLRAADDTSAAFTTAQTEFFENRIRPLFVAHCQECHGGEKQESGFALVSRDSLLKGGQSGPAVVPGKPEESLLVEAVRYDGLEMPPTGRLKDEEIAAIEQWVRDGAAWTPGGGGPVLGDQKALFEEAKSHWAFQPVRKPPVPQVKVKARVRTPVDAFILAKVEAAGLEPAALAPARTIIRRLSFDLIGLPPSADEIDAFVTAYEGGPHAGVPHEQLTPPQRRERHDHRERVYAELVEKLLASPHYGERWGRHWLDVARYADTRDFLAAGADRRYPFAWTYRDWVVQAFNADMPFDRFLRLQIAADSLAESPDDPNLAALGLLTVGPRFINKVDEQIADRIDVVGRGFLGLTISCARCHDHKYDPIPTADYYGLYGVFASCEEPAELPLIAGRTPAADLVADYEKARRAAVDVLTTYGEKLRDEAMADFRKRPGDYLAGYFEMNVDKSESIRGLVDKRKLKETAMTPLADNLDAPRRRQALARDPVLGVLVRLLGADAASIGGIVAAVAADGSLSPPKGPPVAVSPVVLDRLKSSLPADKAGVLGLYGEILAEAERRWQETVAKDPGAKGLMAAEWEQVRQLLYPPADRSESASPFVLDAKSCINASRLLGTGRKQLADLENAIKEVDATHPGAPPRSFVLVDKPKPVEPVVFLRGEPQRRGPQVTRHFLTVLGGGEPFRQGSGRRELADAVASRDNPLTARVFVNRVWSHHFGRAIVDTPSDFGFRANPPSHPELLDWLAATFMEEGWSVKNLHRLIVLSTAYRQRSDDPPKPGAAADARAPESSDDIDPDNRLLAHANRRRLDFESMRDAMLAVSGGLDATLGGRAVDLSATPYTGRRTLYGFIDRLNLDPIFPTFDFASPDVTAAERPLTMIPQQALFAMNHPFVIARARAICGADAFTAAPDDAARARLLYRTLFGREPTPREIQLTTEFVRSTPRGDGIDRATWHYGHGDVAAEGGSPARFAPLPFFDGKNYQISAAFPDPKLGFLRLSAAGGHPGRTANDAVIRRWVSPIDGVVEVSGVLQHLRDKGDGVRGRVVRTDGSVLGEWLVFNDRAETTLADVPVRRGDVLDFAVDCRGNSNSDAFSWAPQVAVVVRPGSGARAASWAAQADFAAPPPPLLTPWEQCAQALLLTNEFWFID